MSCKIACFAFLLLFVVSQGKQLGTAFPFTVPDATFSVTSYGAKGDGKTDDTSAIQATFDAAGKSGGTVSFPAGNYLTFPFKFSGSSTILELAKGATILASTDRSKWPGGGNPTAFITGGGTNLGITGSGTVNGQGSAWWPDKSAGRPNLVQLNANRLVIQGVTFVNSPGHNLELFSNFVELDGVTITAPGDSPNTDGVDVHGTPFYIHDCHISVGDDNVAIHASNVLVENCVFGTGHGASIGSIGSGDYTNITVRGVTFDGTDNGPRIKTDSGATGTIKGVVYEDLTFSNVKTGLTIDMFYADGPVKPTTMKISDITYSNITGSASSAGSLKCQPSSPCEGITLKNIKISDSNGWACENISGSQSSVSPSACIKS